jgi:predicted nucleic acid-binding protein
VIVVSDSTPLNILIRIGLVDILPNLYGQVLIPVAVRDEMSHQRTPEVVRVWINGAPPWLHVRAPLSPLPLVRKGRGELEAISLAVELKAELLLVDDRDAAKTARQYGLATVGTLGMLELASARGIHPLTDSATRLLTSDFFIDPELVALALARDQERRKS